MGGAGASTCTSASGAGAYFCPQATELEAAAAAGKWTHTEEEPAQGSAGRRRANQHVAPLSAGRVIQQG